MAAKLTWLTADGQPQCGHSRDVGYPGEDREWWCELCAAPVDAALDQELAAAEDATHRRGTCGDA